MGVELISHEAETTVVNRGWREDLDAALGAGSQSWVSCSDNNRKDTERDR